MSEQLGWRALLRHVREEAPNWGILLPQLPRLAHQALSQNRSPTLEQAMARLLAEQKRHTWLLWSIAGLLTGILAWLLAV